MNDVISQFRYSWAFARIKVLKSQMAIVSKEYILLTRYICEAEYIRTRFLHNCPLI